MKVLFDFFNQLDREKWSGEVHVTSSQGHAYLLFKNGQLIWSHRPLDRAIERFQKISWLNLPPIEVLSSARSWEVLVGDILSANHDQYTRLVKFLKTERLEIFFRIFFWSNVEIIPRGFEVTLPDPVLFGFYNPRKLRPLIEEAAHRLKEWPTIQEKMGHSRRVFMSVVNIPELSARQIDEIDRALMTAEETPSSILNSLPYSPEEIELLRLCDGTSSVQDIIRQSLDGEYLVLRRLLRLWSKGAIRPKDEETIVKKVDSQMLRMKTADWLSAVWIVVWVGLSIGILSIFESLSHSTVVVPTSLTQAIEVFRHKQGHYPLSLEELTAESALRGLPIDAYRYVLLQSDEYQITTKK